MRIWTVGVIGLLAASGFLYLNLASGKEVLTEIDTLLPEGKKEYEACTAFKTKVQRLGLDGQHSDSPAHNNKEQSLAVLALLETYPGTAPSFARAARLFEDNHELLAKRIDQIPLMVKRAEIEGECDIFTMLVHTQLLLKDIRAHKLEPFHAKRIRRLVKSYLNSDMPAHSLLSLAVRASVLENWMNLDGTQKAREEKAAKARAFLAKFEERRREIADNSLQNSQGLMKYSMFTLWSLTPELLAIRELGTDYKALLEEARI